MTDADEALVQFLLSRPGVVGEVGERIYPSPLPQKAVLPAVTSDSLGASTQLDLERVEH